MQVTTKITLILATTLAAGCGAVEKKAASAAAGGSGQPGSAAAGGTDPGTASNATATTPAGNRAAAAPVLTPADASTLVALSPSELGMKVLAAMGPGMTKYADTKGVMQDYLTINATQFTGAISPNAYTQIAAKLEDVNYFMALAGLSEVVSRNYAAAVAGGQQGAVTYNCTLPNDAQAMVHIIWPPASDADVVAIGAEIQKSCAEGVQTAVIGIMNNLAFALKSNS